MLEHFWRFWYPKFEKLKNKKKWPRSHVEAGKTCRFISGISGQT